YTKSVSWQHHHIFGDNVPNMSHSGIMEDIKKA
ncbi:hypothetical protein, partial [Escherichia coli]